MSDRAGGRINKRGQRIPARSPAFEQDGKSQDEQQGQERQAHSRCFSPAAEALAERQSGGKKCEQAANSWNKLQDKRHPLAEAIQLKEGFDDGVGEPQEQDNGRCPAEFEACLHPFHPPVSGENRIPGWKRG